MTVRSSIMLLDTTIGVDSGPVMADVSGGERALYDVWGETVATAGRPRWPVHRAGGQRCSIEAVSRSGRGASRCVAPWRLPPSLGPTRSSSI